MKFNIGMIGPSAAGKTSLMTAMFQDMHNHLVDNACTGTHVSIEVADGETKAAIEDSMVRFEDCIRMKKFIAWPRNKQTANFGFKVMCSFDGQYKSFGFEIMDYPGGLLTNPEEFARICFPHIQKSCAIFVPIDAVALMKYSEIAAINAERAEAVLSKLEIDRVLEVIKQWIVSDNKSARKLFFVPVKTESYFRDSVGFQSDQSLRLRQLVEDLYISQVKNECREKSIDIVYNPVDTYGCVSLFAAEWDDQAQSLSEEFSVCGNASMKIKGAVDLFSQILKSQLEKSYAITDSTVKDGQCKIDKRGLLKKLYYKLFPDPVKDQVAVSTRARDLYCQAIGAISDFTSTGRLVNLK